jgi:glycosyltransferase involved in cell wall biosynthesis
MKVLHILYSGGIGGIENLCKDIGSLDPLNNFFLFLYEGGTICNEMKKLGLKVFECKIYKHNYLRALHQIKRIQKGQDIQVLMFHHCGTSLWIPSILLKHTNKELKIVLYAHNAYENFIKGSGWRKHVFEKAVKNCDGIIAISNFVKKTVEEACPKSIGKIVVNYNGVNTERFNCVRDTRFDTPMKILYVGRLITEKGVILLVDALKMVDIPYTLDIVGEGPDKENIEDEIKKLGLEENIHLLGARRDIADRTKKADVFIHPAIWKEGFGITVVEAMSAGAVCIAFNRGAIPEIIEDGKSGCLVKDISKEGMTKMIEEVYQKLRIDNMIDVRLQAQKRADEFTVENTVKRMQEIICELCGEM